MIKRLYWGAHDQHFFGQIDLDGPSKGLWKCSYSL